MGSYNDGKRGFNGWTEADEKRLYHYLDVVNRSGNKFMMSNVIEHKDKRNSMLEEWIIRNNYKIIKHEGSARKGRKEILVINYD